MSEVASSEPGSLSQMDALLRAVQEACTGTVWKRAQHLAQTGTINGKPTHNDEIEVVITTRGGMAAPLVVLLPADADWSCECENEAEVCVHAAAAAIGIHASVARNEGIPGVRDAIAKVAYQLTRSGGHLAIERFLVRGKKRTPLHTRLSINAKQDTAEDVSASQADLQVDVIMGPLSAGRIPRPLVTRLLSALKECNDVVLDGKKVRIDDPRPVIRVCVEDQKEGFRVFAEQDPGITEVFSNGAVLRGKTLCAIGELDLSPRDVEGLREGRLYPFGQVADLAGRILPALAKRLPVENHSKIMPGATSMPPRIVLKADYDGDSLTVLPTLVYGDPPAARVDGGKLHYLGGALPLRSERKEKLLVEALRSGLEMAPGHAERYYGNAAVRMAQRIRSFHGASLEGEGLEACFVAAPLEASFDFDASELGITFSSNEDGTQRRASPEAVVRAWQRGESLVPLVDGGWAPLPQAVLERCGDLLADLVAAKEENEKLPASALPDLARLCESLDAPPPPGLERLRGLAEDFDGIEEAPLPDDLTGTLRDYQRQGVNWLRFLSNADMGGMLADDMGLGKTLQALCSLTSPCLVVAPASVMHNWIAEVARFRPGLRAHAYHGPGRSIDEDAHIVVTTYAILRIDAELLSARQWDTVILDEAQYIKNADSQVAQAAFSLQARFRLTMTGTPVENRLEELWSQFHFINRGLLGGRRDFQDRYARPVSEGDELALRRLRTRIRPFLLRREKRNVAKELPPRTDVVARCTLSEDERTLYESIHAATRKEVVEQLAQGGSVLAALEALLRLRQASCHPGLLPGQSAADSAKVRLLMEMLTEVVEEGHKALVFSQWTSMLNLIEPHLDSSNVPYVRLDGSTRDRGGVVTRFQQTDGPPVMLVSLRAGGTGLNLTEADNVFLVDPWWNPAVEEQAADRAHRIGQTRPVLVHRLITEDTVEERMLVLKERKRALANAATGGGQAASGGITRDDLLALLG